MQKGHKEGNQPFFTLSGDLPAAMIGDVADYYENNTTNNHVIRFGQDIDQPGGEEMLFNVLGRVEDCPHAGVVIETSSFSKALSAFRYTNGSCDIQLSGAHPPEKLRFLKGTMGDRCLAIKVTEKEYYFSKEAHEDSAHFENKLVGRTQPYAPYSVVMFDGANRNVRAVLTGIQKRQIRSGLYIASDGIGDIYPNIWANQKLSLNVSFGKGSGYEDVIKFLNVARKTYCEGQYA